MKTQETLKEFFFNLRKSFYDMKYIMIV